MIKTIPFSDHPRWFYIAFGLLSALFAATLVSQSYMEYRQDVHAIDQNLSRRGTAITRTLIAAIESNYQQGQLTSESMRKLLDNTVSSGGEPYAARVKTAKDVEIAMAGPADLLKKGQNPAHNLDGKEMFVSTDEFQLHRHGVEANQNQPQEIAEGQYVLSVAIGATVERIDQTTEGFKFGIRSMWCVVIGIWMFACVHYERRIRILTAAQSKPLTQDGA